MITSMTKEYQSQYEALFTEAFEALKNANKLSEDELALGRFSSLEQYFTRIADLYDIDPKYVMLLPLDEPFFEINANTREIGIPAHFKKYGVSVQGDSIAETLLFSISRFIDAFDMDADMEIYVQWEINGREGHSRVDFTYIDKDPELLVFAWPLTHTITKDAGVLKFSVRFVKKNGDQTTYSYNTLAASVDIKKALKSDLEYAEEVDTAEHLFKNAIANTTNTSTGGAAKISIPSFEAPGVMLPKIAYLKNDQLVLTAQAIVTDAGEISYRWTYAPLDTDVTTQPGTAKDEYVLTEDTTPVENKRYYKIDTSVEPTNYVPYPHDSWDETDLDAGLIYERFAGYTILSGDVPVVGSYTLVANNRVGFDSKNTNANNSSPVCVVPGPEVLNFKVDGGNLTKTAVLSVVTGEDGEASHVLALDVEVDKDADIPADVDGVKLTYEWEKTVSNPNAEDANPLWVAVDEVTAVLEETGDETLAGWYRVKVTSELNRATKSIESEICKVTAPIKAPVLAHPEGADLIVKNVNTGDSVDLQAALATPYAGELESEGLTYRWFMGDTDSPTLIVNDTDVYGQGTDTLHVNYTGTPTVYRCEVTNHIEGQSDAVSMTGDFFVS